MNSPQILLSFIACCAIVNFGNLTAQNNFNFAIEQPATPMIIDAGPDQVLFEGNEVVLGGSPTATGGYGNYTFLWDNAAFLDNPNIANPTASGLTQATTFTLTVRDSNNVCVKQDQVIVDIFTSLSSIIRESVKIFPNPFSDIVLIEADEIIKSIKVFSITGQVVWEQDQLFENNLQLETQRFQSGVYFFVIILKNETIITKRLCKTFTN